MTRDPRLDTTLGRVPADEPVLLLSHDPDVFPHVPDRVSLTLAGPHARRAGRHPVVRDKVTPSQHGAHYTKGHQVEGGRHLFVSPGVGTSRLPIRFGARARGGAAATGGRMSTIVVHGGCGNPAADAIADEHAYHDALRAAVDAADAVLRDGGAALDAAQAAVESLEDAPQFNAGRGSVLTADGLRRDGRRADERPRRPRRRGRRGRRRPRHPIALARAVMDATDARDAGRHGRRAAGRPSSGSSGWRPTGSSPNRQRERWWKARGTVGAVVLDDDGPAGRGDVDRRHRPASCAGRVGDSPLIGAGT